jgi:hypothetical protein
MASARQMLERRRASRLSMKIPVKIRLAPGNQSPEQSHHSAEAVAVSRTGGLLRVPFSPELGSRIEVLHGISEERREFRVIQVSKRKADGLFELGVEMLHPTRSNFWGVKFPDDAR